MKGCLDGEQDGGFPPRLHLHIFLLRGTLLAYFPLCHLLAYFPLCHLWS